MRKNCRRYSPLFLCAFAFFFMRLDAVEAQTISLTAPKTAYEVGESFRVSFAIDTGGYAINTISGSIDIPQQIVEITDVRYGNSVVSLWVEKPAIDYQKGIVTFSGGVPGGFRGSQGPILSIGLRGRRIGNNALTFLDTTVLLNDGLGTKLEGLRAVPLQLKITAAAPKPVQPAAEAALLREEEPPASDIQPPEPFTPLVARDPSIASGKYFVSFFAVDKDTGISYYEVREVPRFLSRFAAQFPAEWVRAESPYVLKRQQWPTQVFVRAYDQAENVTEAITAKPVGSLLVWIGAALLALVAVLIEFLLLRPKRASRARAKDARP